jgi:hypothetical protein
MAATGFPDGQKIAFRTPSQTSRPVMKTMATIQPDNFEHGAVFSLSLD